MSVDISPTDVGPRLFIGAAGPSNVLGFGQPTESHSQGYDQHNVTHPGVEHLGLTLPN